MMSIRTCFTLIVAVLMFPLSVLSQIPTSYYFPSGSLPANTKFNPAITTPEQFFGFQIGEWHLRPEQIDAYLEMLLRQSPRLKREQYGTSVEMRPLTVLIATSPKHHSNLAELKSIHKQLSISGESTTRSVSSIPAVLWMGYSVHGNESSGANAVPLVAYYLSAAESPSMDSLLNNTILLIDPHINPDGLARFAHWANIHKGEVVNSDPNHAEHLEPWLSGRFNHYWFDLNRDWMPAQQKESKARMRLYHEWMPNLLTDHHEMGSGSTFFFQPGVPSRTNPLTSKENQRLTERIAAYHATQLDGIGSLYYTKENFDDFYYGKGSTFPDIHGGVGILFEQASSRGHAQATRTGTLTFPFTIRNQVQVSLSTMNAVTALHDELLRHQARSYREAVEAARKQVIKGYVVSAVGGDNARLSHFAELLTLHEIEFGRLKTDVTVSGVRFKAEESLFMPLEQRQTLLLQALFQRDTRFKDSLFYDISSWNMASAFGLQFSEVRERLVTTPFKSADVKGEFVPSSSLHTVGFLIEWSQYYTPKLLYRLLKSGASVRIAQSPFTLKVGREGTPKRFERGTLFLASEEQPLNMEALKRRLIESTEQEALQIYQISSSQTQEGISLGSDKMSPLSQPKIALIIGRGASPTDAGDVWHLLDQRFGIDVTLLEAHRLSRVNLTMYDRIIFAGGTYTELDSEGKNVLTEWVEKGGILIALETAAEWAIKNKLSSAKMKAEKNDSTTLPVRYEDGPLLRGARQIGGVILRGQLDVTHPLAFGYLQEEMSIFRSNKIILEDTRGEGLTPLRYGATPLLSGYLHPKDVALIKSSVGIHVTRKGKGLCIISPESLNFRAFWYGTNKLFLNMLFLSPMLQSGGSVGFEEHTEEVNANH